MDKMFEGKTEAKRGNIQLCILIYVKMERTFYFNLYFVVLNEKTFCFEYYSIIACGLTDLNTWTFESFKIFLWPFKICI